ncbi:hypothetical protein ONS95_010485 [Cadophora gregata]|uniref:uncharacterized protein n=1 Tax=Cadophora gregata TaxID=51156 RepID=UPI0026DD594D|nr:uncharacterized protein ONS95_010485 [Cadophora gregata]KAK0122232.1 hypothetical protein ONS95_010485 [Cadophora gregata]
MASKGKSTAVTKDYGKRTAIVTGSARGIGKAIAIRLAEDGFDVCINDIAANKAGIEEVLPPSPTYPKSPRVFFETSRLTSSSSKTVKKIQSLGRSSYGHVADVSKLSEVEALIAASVKNLGPLNVMIANAGIAQVKALLDLSEDDVRRMFEVNVFGVFNCYSAAAKQMIKQGGGGKIVGAAR